MIYRKVYIYGRFNYFLTPDQKALEGAFPYSITSDGNVWRGSKKLVQQFKNGRWYAQIYREDGTKWSFDSTKMASSIFDPEPLPLLKNPYWGILTTLV